MPDLLGWVQTPILWFMSKEFGYLVNWLGDNYSAIAKIRCN